MPFLTLGGSSALSITRIAGADGPKFAVINASSSGTTEIIALVSGKSLVILAYTIIAAGDVTCEFRSGTTTVLIDNLDITTNSGAAPSSIFGLQKTASGESLTLNLSAAIAVGGSVTYAEV